MTKIVNRVKRGNPVSNLVLLFLAALTFYPLFFTLLTSFKDNEQFFANFWGLPNPIILDNYADAFTAIMPFAFNSLVIAVSSITTVLFTTSLSAYAFARLRFPCKEILYMTVLALLMIPGLLLLIPQFILVRDLGLMNSFAGISLGYIAGGQAFSIFVIRAFFDTLPGELFEAAEIDGCSEFKAYYRIALPLIKPVLGTIAIITLLGIWNDYLWPLIVTTDAARLPIALGLLRFIGTFTTTMYGPMFAGFIVASLPLIVLFFILMRSFLEGLTAGAIKA